MNPNEQETSGGLPASLRGVAAISVIVVALVGVLAVLEVIPREALQEWFTKIGLVALIVVGAAIAVALLARAGGGKKS
jgi:hypothetical protein